VNNYHLFSIDYYCIYPFLSIVGIDYIYVPWFYIANILGVLQVTNSDESGGTSTFSQKFGSLSPEANEGMNALVACFVRNIQIHLPIRIVYKN
jgi:hypothetical protein